MKTKLGKRKCKACGEVFQKLYPLQPVCSKKCEYAYKKSKAEGKPKKKQKAIPPVSQAMLNDLAIYRPIRDKYLSEHPICEVADCNNPTTNLHHKAGRTGYFDEESRFKGLKLLWDVRFFMACCSQCHPKRIHENPKWAYENGYLVKTKL